MSDGRSVLPGRSLPTGSRDPSRPGPATSADPTDAEIGAGLASGDERCLELAFRRWGRLVHGLASRTLGDPLEAEDVTQQVFLAAWRGRGSYRPDRGPVPAWLVGITRYKIADALSDRTRRLSLVVEAAAGPQPQAAADGELDRLLDRVVVADELERLSPAQRDVLALAYFADLTQQQIAQRTGMPLGTVKAHCRRGLLRMRVRLAPQASAVPRAPEAGPRTGGRGSGPSGKGSAPNQNGGRARRAPGVHGVRGGGDHERA
ncbi:sigma-70 family RNA polymerase sigma factor [Streptomyces goshikiensis]|uniref:sigma-70 family RNA polymerase sigma factor n=1 Tax=Streptomyces goshikiensis TaxID=1942 RepID=UPI0016750C48|nr:sigma-70 family RNA polymerase sigma factor [Streptomyces goshikiensis]GHD83371.1 RNA polymerase sigma factor [Streptomyces goshikiensis]